MSGICWDLAPGKVIPPEQARRLLAVAAKTAQTGGKCAVRDYLIVHLALGTGLRVMEISQLKCGDVHHAGPLPFLHVRMGKGGRERHVHFNGSLRTHLTEYLQWKDQTGEPGGAETPLLVSSHTRRHMTTRAMQKAFKRTVIKAGLPARYSIHCARHTYATMLYSCSGHNLRLVQKQLGHANIRTTQVYADTLTRETAKALEKLGM